MTLTCIGCNKTIEINPSPELQAEMDRYQHVKVVAQCGDCIRVAELLRLVNLTMSWIRNEDSFAGIGYDNMQVILRATARIIESPTPLTLEDMKQELEFQIAQVER